MVERWTEYIADLFEGNRGEKPAIQKLMDGPKILISEVRTAVSKMKRIKAVGPDRIVAEVITTLEEFGLVKLPDCITENYDTRLIPDDLSNSIFIALPKKPGLRM